MKLLVIGIDAFSSDFFDQELEDYPEWNWLFDKIENGEAYKETLHSTSDRDIPHTGPEWASIYTGVKPEEHGITDHGWKKEHLDYSNIEKKTVFEMIDEEGLRQAIYSMPVTYPAPQIGNGWSISGFPSPLGTSEGHHVGRNADSFFDAIVPRDKEIPRNIIQVKDELPRDDIRSLKPWGQTLTEEEMEEVIDRAQDIELTKSIAFATPLAHMKAVDVGFYGTHGVDKAGHVEGLEPEGPYTEVIYEEMGRNVEFLLDRLNPDHWMIVSDHGFQMHKKKHDRKGVFISSFNHKMHSKAEKEGLETRDVAWQISYQLEDMGLVSDFSDGWIGDDRPTSASKRDEEEIKRKLQSLGYL